MNQQDFSNIPIIGMFANQNFQKGAEVGGPLMGLFNMLSGDKARTVFNNVPLVGSATKGANQLIDMTSMLAPVATKKKKVVKKKAVKNGNKNKKKKNNKKKAIR
jgi:hypothetical protein